MNSFNFISLLLTTFVYKSTATVVVIECIFPCPKGNDHVCEVTDKDVKCKRRDRETKYGLFFFFLREEKKSFVLKKKKLISALLIDGF